MPHIVTDRAIDLGRRADFDRLIVWYRMPHLNFIADAVDWSSDTSLNTLMAGPEPVQDLRPEEQSYDPAITGEVSRERVRDLYRQNLQFVLAYADILLENIDAEAAVVTADHGKGLGDGVWGHPYGYHRDPTTLVPWVHTSATDKKTYTPRYDELERDLLGQERQELLENMGYT